MAPEPWEFALLALAVFRTWKLIADDDVASRPRDWAIARLGPRLDGLLACPWCSGWWLSLAWWAAWVAFPTEAVFVAVPWALSAAVGLLASAWRRLDG